MSLNAFDALRADAPGGMFSGVDFYFVFFFLPFLQLFDALGADAPGWMFSGKTSNFLLCFQVSIFVLCFFFRAPNCL